jgi:hypothetical protein
VPLVQFAKLDLPIIQKPPRGYHYSSQMTPVGLPSVFLRVIWDGGAEGITISVRAASLILRAQGDLSTRGHERSAHQSFSLPRASAVLWFCS